ncbi:hypothetical protein APS67_003075 [Streptomyces sp. AVP053U2]|nr:hypothetical protein APS67_003075 [Streptomyces sp. AVP053U2]
MRRAWRVRRAFRAEAAGRFVRLAYTLDWYIPMRLSVPDTPHHGRPHPVAGSAGARGEIPLGHALARERPCPAKESIP